MQEALGQGEARAGSPFCATQALAREQESGCWCVRGSWACNLFSKARTLSLLLLGLHHTVLLYLYTRYRIYSFNLVREWNQGQARWNHGQARCFRLPQLLVAKTTRHIIWATSRPSVSCVGAVRGGDFHGCSCPFALHTLTSLSLPSTTRTTGAARPQAASHFLPFSRRP